MVKNGNVFFGFVCVLVSELRKGFSSLFFGDAADLYEAALGWGLERVVDAGVVSHFLGVHLGPRLPFGTEIICWLLMGVYFCNRCHFVLLYMCGQFLGYWSDDSRESIA